MKQLTSFQYQLTQHKTKIIYYYIILLGIMVSIYFGRVIAVVSSSNDTGTQSGGFELSSAIFLFVVGLNSFKENFEMLLQNGVSRKSLYKSRIAVTFTIAAIMATIDKVYILVLQYISTLTNKFNIMSLYEQLYIKKITQMSVWKMNLENYFLSFFMYIAFMALGYFITLLFYRMDKKGKIAVGAGVPIGLTILPNIDFVLFDGKYTSMISKLFDFSFGLSNSKPFHAMISFLIIFLVCSILSWILIKKAMIKK